MELKPSTQTVYQALQALYGNSSSSEREKANVYLLNLQKSVHAWNIADQLLMGNADLNSSLFGAQMIRNKILYSFHELPPDVCPALYESLLQHLKNVDKNSNPVVITQLCLAMVDLCIQMSTWKNPVANFFSQTNELPPHIVIELLSYFPEEIDRKPMRLGTIRRNEIYDQFSSSASTVNDLLEMYMISEQRNEVILKIIMCMSSWLTVGIADLSNILNRIVLNKLFEMLKNPPDVIFQQNEGIECKIHDAASDCICLLLQYIKVKNADLFENVASLEGAYHLSVARESTEKSINYCRIFTDLGDSYLPLMVRETKPRSPHFSIKALDLVLTCVGHHDYEVAMVTFRLWYALSEHLYSINDDDLSNEFKPYIERLLTSLCRQVQMEPDHEGLLEDSDDFKIFRVKVTEVIKDVIFIVGSARCFRQMFMSLQMPDLTWDQIEAHLYIMTAIARNLLPDENDVVPKAVNAILQIPSTTHIAVQYSAVLLIGELCEWFDVHPEHLFTALDFIVGALQQSQLANAAATALHNICCVSKYKLKDNFAPLMQIIRSLQRLNLDNEHNISLIGGIMSVMSELPVEQITPVMKEICWQHTSQIFQLIENKTEIKKGTSTDPITWLDRIAAIFRFTNATTNGVENPSAPVLNEMLPLFIQILNHYQSDGRIMERCCRCLRFAIRCVGKSGSFVVEPLAKELVILYSNHQHSCFMYLGSILVDVYGKNCENWNILLQMVEAFIAPTFALLKDPKGLQNHPDTIDDLFRLCSRFMQKLPIAFLQSPCMVSLLECALASVSLDHKDANASVMKFFHEILNFDDKDEDVEKHTVRKQVVTQILERCGETLVYNMIHAIVYTLQTSQISEISDVLLDILHFDRPITIKWIKTVVEQLPKQTSAGATIITDQQVNDYLNVCETVTSTKQLTRALKDFAYFYR